MKIRDILKAGNSYELVFNSVEHFIEFIQMCKSDGFYFTTYFFETIISPQQVIFAYEQKPKCNINVNVSSNYIGMSFDRLFSNYDKINISELIRDNRLESIL